MILIVVNGYPGSGKTTFENFCLDFLDNTETHQGMIVSTVDYIKEVAKFIGWDGQKRPEDRRLLSDLKDALSLWGDIPFNKIKEACARAIKKEEETNKKIVLFVDSREPKEIERFRTELSAITVIVERYEDVKTSNHADAGIKDFNYDVKIDNTGELETLKFIAKLFVERIIKSGGGEYD